MADSSKTEQATEERLRKAREQGQVARSRELPGTFALFAVAGALMVVMPGAAMHWGALYRAMLNAADAPDFAVNGPILFWGTVEVLRWMVPVLLAGFAAALFVGLAQGGINFAPAALQPKIERLNPATKLGQIFSPVGLANLLKSLLPFGVILWLAVSAMRENWSTIVNASALGLRPFASFTGSMLFSLAWKSGLVLLAWSVVDYVLIRRKMTNDLKMTRQEIKEEHKELDGNPQIKQRIRQIQRAMRRKAQLQAVPTASVVVTNPTHFAVALKYAEGMAAPELVAKGRDLIAEKIRQIAREHDIPLMENKPLAQALYKSVEVGDSIPAKLYQAVAELLALVYRAQAEVRRAEAARSSRDASGRPLGGSR